MNNNILSYTNSRIGGVRWKVSRTNELFLNVWGTQYVNLVLSRYTAIPTIKHGETNYMVRIMTKIRTGRANIMNSCWERVREHSECIALKLNGCEIYRAVMWHITTPPRTYRWKNRTNVVNRTMNFSTIVDAKTGMHWIVYDSYHL